MILHIFILFLSICFCRHVLYFSTVCDNDDQGKAALLSAMSTLVRPQVPENSESESVVENDNVEAKPVVLWRALYVQELVKVWNMITAYKFGLC